VPGTKAESWYLGDGALSDMAPRKQHVDRYRSDPSLLPGTDFAGGTGTGALWGNASQWSWDWKQRRAGTAVSYVSAPLEKDVTTVGAGAVQLWVKSSARDLDFQATVSEVRDGHETFVQSGWLRGSDRKLATSADNIMKQQPSLLEPIPTLRAADVSPMPSGRYTKVVIPLYFQGHAYRAGSRIRVTIAAPNGTQPIWSFSETEPLSGTSAVAIQFAPSMPSSLVLPVVAGVGVPTALPPCPSLRNEPCRPFAATIASP
jgi:predicted acyl esterase